ncbi:MAG TPA: flippase activity-associated protein Agl23 [Tepidisphaeraceae bacterium]|nr:flippase activity-associated protein Agl23 [Tepidisphaeraceae bacterium]
MRRTKRGRANLALRVAAGRTYNKGRGLGLVMWKRWILLAALVLVAGGALASRMQRLCDRPFHGDEAIHAWKFGELWNTGNYEYDPFEYHGPTLNYFTLPVMWVTGQNYIGASEAYYRIVPVVFGVGLILLLWLVREDLGYWETLVAGVLTAISPAMVFYSRYYIQEMLLVFLTFGAMVGLWRYARSGRAGWALLAGVCFGLMHATKETWVIQAAALAGAAVVAVGWAWLRDGQRPALRRVLQWKALVVATLAGILVASLFLSAFLHNSKGPIDSIRTYTTYLDRGRGNTDHVHSWDYYLRLLGYFRSGRGPIFSEGLILGLAAVGVGAALVARRGGRGKAQLSEPPEAKAAPVPVFSVQPIPTSSGIRVPGLSMPAAQEPDAAGQAEGDDAVAQRWRRWFWIFIASYTVLLTAAYSAVPYKTPWCLLGFLHGMILLAAVGAVALIRGMPHWSLKVVLVLLLLAGMWQLGSQAYRQNYDRKFLASQYNPWIYSHPGLKFFELADRMEELAAVSKDKHQMLVKVFTKDIWPLPWYMRRFEKVGYWAEVPEDVDAPVVICSREQEEAVAKRLKGKYQVDYFGLRPTVVVPVYVRMELWEAFLATRAAVKPQ